LPENSHTRQPIVEARNIAKSYDEVQALRAVDLDIYAGEVLGLLGANGAGKSTLIRILTGVVTPDSGQVTADGAALKSGVKAARAAGIVAVHQELNLVPTATAAENIFLWSLPKRGGLVSKREMNRKATAVLEQMKVDLPVDALAADLTPVQQRLVMVAAAISQDVKVLILDEPTASLPVDEAAHLLEVVRGLRSIGKAVVFVSHRLEEVVSIADRAVVMRDGRIVAELRHDDVQVDSIMELIGAKRIAAIDKALATRATSASGVILSARGVTGTRVRQIALDINAGEIVGVAGLVGAGRSELLRLLAGVQTQRAGEIHLRGRRTTRRGLRGEVGYVGERRADNLFHDFTVGANVSLPSLPRFTRGRWVVKRGEELASVTETLQRTQVKGRAQDPITALSGGNKQKVLVARWLMAGTRVLIFDEPTAGVDVAARAEIHSLLRAVANDGGAVVVAIADPKELLSLCDRVVVLREGAVTLDSTGPFDEAAILAASYQPLAAH